MGRCNDVVVVWGRCSDGLGAVFFFGGEGAEV